MLDGSEHVIPNDKELSEAERKALMRMTMEEVRLGVSRILICPSVCLFVCLSACLFVLRQKREGESYVG